MRETVYIPEDCGVQELLLGAMDCLEAAIVEMENDNTYSESTTHALHLTIDYIDRIFESYFGVPAKVGTVQYAIEEFVKHQYKQRGAE